MVFNITPRQNVRTCTGPQSHHQGSKIFHLKKSKIKTILITFFDKQVVIHKQFVPEEHTVNSAFYVKIIRKITWLRPQFRAECSWFLLQNDAPSHSALVVKIFLAIHNVVEIRHPLYSPDLNPVDFFLYPMVKTALKRRFQDVEDIKKNVMDKLNTVPLQALTDCFQKLFK
jgi:transposase